MYSCKIPMICLEDECYRSKSSVLCTREEFFRGHVVKKSTEKIKEILIKFHLVVREDDLNRYTLLNIFTDLCKESVALKILEEYQLKNDNGRSKQ